MDGTGLNLFAAESVSSVTIEDADSTRATGDTYTYGITTERLVGGSYQPAASFVHWTQADGTVAGASADATDAVSGVRTRDAERDCEW